MNNEIQEAYCSFEVSKLLKEKGFNIYQPTHAIAIEWLRINFGIWIDIGYEPETGTDMLNEPYKIEWYSMVSKIGYLNLDIPTFHQYNTPQEATEVALLYVLNNLI